MFESLSKQEIINEYGHSFVGMYKFKTSDVFEKFGDADPLDGMDVSSDSEAALKLSIKDAIELKEYIIDKYEHGYNIYKKAWFARPFLFMLMKSSRLKIESLKEEIENIKETSRVVYLEDIAYRIPQVRFHTGETIFIGSLLSDTAKISEGVISHTFISESNGKLSLIYKLEKQTEEGVSRFTYNETRKVFETDVGEFFVSQSRLEVMALLERQVEFRINNLKKGIEKIK